MSYITIPKVELKNRKCQLSFLSKDIYDLNNCELFWLVTTEICNRVPNFYKRKISPICKQVDKNRFNEKYLIFTHKAAGWRSQDRHFRAALFLGKHLNRTVIFNSMILSSYHNRSFNSEPTVSDFNIMYDMKKMNLYTNVISIGDISLPELVSIICDKSKYYYTDEYITSIANIKKMDVKFLCCKKDILFNCSSFYDAEKFKEEIYYEGDFVSSTKSQIQKSEDIINSLGEYYAIHVRRGDILFEESKVEEHKGVTAEEVSFYTDLSKHTGMLKKWIPKGSKIYISTDDEDLTIFNSLKENYDIYFWKDFNIKLSSEENNSYYILAVEEIIMSRAYRFISTIPSVIPTYVDYRRCKIEGIDKSIYNLTFDKYIDFIKKQHQLFSFTLLPSIKESEERLKYE